MEAFKSLESYKFFENGWVKNLYAFKIANEKIIVLGEVEHSMRVNEPALKLWIVCKQIGIIIAGHCNCIAGNCEVCSHIGAVLYAIESSVRTANKAVSTDILCTWNSSKSNKFITPKKIKAINFKQNQNESESPKKNLSAAMDENEIGELLTEIVQATKSNVPPAIALVTPGLNDKYSSIVVTPQPDDIDMMAVNLFLVNEFYNDNYLNLSLEELRKKGSEIKIEYTSDDMHYVEKMTNGIHNWYWQRFRAGRITATQFLNACRTAISKPSISTINSICWPEKTLFTSVATEYGITHEPEALKSFSVENSLQHVNFR